MSIQTAMTQQAAHMQPPPSSPRIATSAANRYAVVGIVLGTSHSALACIDAARIPTIVPNAQGDIFTPSVVLFEGRQAFAGSRAREALLTNPGSGV